MAQQVVGAAQIQSTADQLDDLKMRALDVLSRYQQHSTELQASGGLDGQGRQTQAVLDLPDHFRFR